METLTGKQLRSVQTLYSKWAGHALDVVGADGRTERLAWATQELGREVASFKELTVEEAGALINALKRALGQPVSEPRPRPMNRAAALAAGTHGRRGRRVKTEVLAAAADLERVEQARVAAGMTPEGFAAWLRSARSPLHGREDVRLLTVGDCNRVLWPLKAMARRRAKREAQAQVC